MKLHLQLRQFFVNPCRVIPDTVLVAGIPSELVKCVLFL